VTAKPNQAGGRRGREPRLPPIGDISGSAFANVDAHCDPKTFITYLDAATAQLAELKRLSYGALGLEPGFTVLDVGCGTGEDLRHLAAIVGSSGLAIGVDSSRAMIAEARRRTRIGLEVEFIVGDAERLDLARDSFNACRADRVMQHLADPARALAEMVRVATPGGAVQAIDRDWGLVAVDSADRSTTQAILDRACDGIRNGWIGRRLPALFHYCGLEDVRTIAAPLTTTDFAIADTMLDLEAVARAAREQGKISAQASTAWLRDLKERGKSGRFFACWVIFVVTGRKSK
jgi:ubiquinone/menaquinone biosynthesis C-methylase UbiE